MCVVCKNRTAGVVRFVITLAANWRGRILYLVVVNSDSMKQHKGYNWRQSNVCKNRTGFVFVITLPSKTV